MRTHYHRLPTLLLALATVALFGTGQARAQAGDTLLVEWETEPGSGQPLKNALRDAIINDTGWSESRVYLLRRGGFYWITDPIDNAADHPLSIKGQEASQARAEDNVCGPNFDQDCGPAIIQRVNRDDGTTPSGTMFNALGSLRVENVWLMGQTDVGALANYEPIKLLGDGKRYVFDRVVFDRNDWHHLGPDGPNNDFWITNSVFRNLFGPTQIWEGLGVRFEVGADTVVIENNTFFNIGFTPFQSEAAPVNYLRFNHNTLVNIGRSFQAGALWKEAYVANNLFVNGFIQGESPSQYNAPDRADPYTGFFSIGQLPAQFGTNLERRVVLANNLWWRDPAFDAIYQAQNIRPQPFVNDTTMGWFDRFDAMVIAGNIEGVRPNLATYPLTPQMLDSFSVWISNLYSDPVIQPAPRWFWDPGREEDCFVCSIWPLPENFAYDNASLQSAGTDGLPLGDLNWFPQAKATFEANRAAFVEEIEDMAGAEVIITPVGGLRQAEQAQVGDNAEVRQVEGFASFYMEGSGEIVWTFDVPAAGEYGFVLHTQSQDAVRGEHLYVNGTEIRNNDGYGEYYFENLPNDSWKAEQITAASLIAGAEALTLNAGTNTFRITPSWGYQGFSGLDVVDAGGNVVVSLTAKDATSTGVQERCEESDYCPSGFGYVELGAGGSLTYTIDAPANGNYLFRVFYASPGATQAQLSVNGNVVFSDIAIGADTSEVLTSQFALSAGANTLTLTAPAGGFSVDAVQLLQVGTATSRQRHELPEGYALGQNYPNPFNPATTIAYEMKAAGAVTLQVYDVLGRLVATLADGQVTAGQHQVRFDGSQLASGVYFYRLQTPVGQMVRTMVLMK